ncbi:hypothetical protein QCA50_013665 [Cerrena zonata]|uniref:Uncharacterized protein n=1 Tax=Cerrena zonata TaxID=2478898 RepID=A0AAW0FVP9_9APHY
MSLDQNLFTLNIEPSKDDPNVLDLTDPSGNAHYKKARVPGNVYKINVYDPLSESLLATATAPNATSKHKTIELHNPSSVVELKYSGTISFKWRFKWEEHEFEWKREECYILRKPDPAVLVAVTKEPPGRLRTSTVQILDYNLNRFDINDRKGLEIVMLTALLTFQDTNDAYHAPTPTPPTVTASTKPTTPGLEANVPSTSSNLPPQSHGPPPMIPPKPAPKTGVERVAELHMIRTLQGVGEANEVEIGVEGGIDDYARYAEGLLKDEAMLFVTLRSASAAQVPKVLQVVEQTKRLRHKSGLAESEDLFQYVVYDAPSGKSKGPKRINLDDPTPTGSKGYKPPSSLMIHLSKIDMPELRPRAESGLTSKPSKYGRDKPPIPVANAKPKKDDKKDKKDKKDDKKHKKDSDKPPAPNKHTRPTGSSPGSSHIRPQSSAFGTNDPFPPSIRYDDSFPYSSPSFPGGSGPSFPVPPPPSPGPFASPPTHPYHSGGAASSFYGPGPGFNTQSPTGGYGYNPGYL